MNDSYNHPSVTQWSTRVQVDRWREGDGNALGRLADRFRPLVRYRIQQNRAFPQLADQVSVEDVEQEVWARILKSGVRAFERNDQRHGFVAWLGQLTDSTVIDLVRRMGREKRGGGKRPGVLDTLAAAQKLRRPGQASQASPTGNARAAEFEELARSVLSERELQAWTWVVMEEYTSTEAALGLDSTPSAVRSLLVRARAKLQEAMQERRSSNE